MIENEARPDPDQYFSEMVTVIAKRSTCLHKKVGALFARNGHIISTGYNGAPTGEPHCSVVGCSKPEHGVGMERCRAVHAEQNAIIQAALLGVSIDGCTLYCTHSPCDICRRMLKNAGITRIVFNEVY